MNSLTCLENILSAVANTLEQTAPHNQGAAFKVNGISKQWRGTLAVRCNHVGVIHIATFIQTLQKALWDACKWEWWEYTSIARCFEYDKINGRKRPIFNRKTVYITLRICPGLFTRLQAVWYKGRYQNLSELVGWLRKQEDYNT